MINPQIDCAGVSWELKQAINKYTDHEAKHAVKQFIMCNNETDVMINENNKEFIDTIKWADIIHINGFMWDTSWEEHFKGKKIIFHFHGDLNQRDPQHIVDKVNEFNGKFFCCEPLFEEVLPEVKYMPNVLNLDYFQPIKRNWNDKLIIKTTHLKSDRRKGIQEVSATLKYLEARGYPIKYEALENIVPKDECTKWRADAHLTLDNLTHGFCGMTAWEGLALGQIVFNRIEPDVMYRYVETFKSTPPIENVLGIDEMALKIREMCDNINLEEQGQRARDWVEQFYQPKTIAQMYIKEYNG